MKSLSQSLMPVFALLSLAGTVCSLQAAEPSETVHWYRDYAEVLRAAKQSRKPIFLEFRCSP